MDRLEKVFEHYDVAADSGSPVANTIDNLRFMLQRLYVSGAGDGMSAWREEDRDLFLSMLLDAGDGKQFVPVPSPWPTETREDEAVAKDLLLLAKIYKRKGRLEIGQKLAAVALELKNGV